jgi:hypothetical protein
MCFLCFCLFSDVWFWDWLVGWRLLLPFDVVQFQKLERSIWLLTNWTHPSIWVLMHMIETCCVWWADLFDSPIFQICWDLQDSRRRVCLYSSTSFLSVLVPVTGLKLLSSKKLLCLMLCSESCWHLDFDNVLAVDPFPIFKP